MGIKGYEYIWVDYYIGSFGPTIVFIIQTEGNLEYFRKLIESVSKNTGCVIYIKEDARFKLLNIQNITFKNQEIHGRKKRLVLSKGIFSKEISFVWGQDTEDWEDVSRLLKEPIAGHKFIYEDMMGDGTLIEVIYRTWGFSPNGPQFT